MKYIKPLFLAIIVSFSIGSCKNQTSVNEHAQVNSNGEDIQVYYFHFSTRCATCNAVENETKLALETYFPDHLSNGTLEFASYNMDEEDGETLAKSLHVSSQTLLLVQGEYRLDLTKEGFMNARTNPDRFREIIKTTIDKLL